MRRRLTVLFVSGIIATGGALGLASPGSAGEEAPREGSWCSDHGQSDGPATGAVNGLAGLLRSDTDIEFTGGGQDVDYAVSSEDVTYFLVEPATCG